MISYQLHINFECYYKKIYIIEQVSLWFLFTWDKLMFYEYRVTYYTRLKTMNNNIISTIMYFERLFFCYLAKATPFGYAKTK